MRPPPLTAPESTVSGTGAARLNFSWLVRLRWGAIVGQALVIAFVHSFLGVALPLPALVAVLAGATLLNVASMVVARRAREVRDADVALAMALDLLLFTGMLYLTGGPANPFSSLYLVHIALAAVVLPSRWSWALVALTLVCSAALFVEHRPLPGEHAHHAAHAGFDEHLRGMWVALAVSASFIVYFLHRVTRALAERDQKLAAERERALRHERVATLATLAAGAAHELASPLATIAVASSELHAELRRANAPEAMLSDVALIREQVTRCRTILDQLAADSGQASGETVTSVRGTELADSALEALPDRDRVDVRSSPEAERAIWVPKRALVQALRSLLHNALRASDDRQRVELEFKHGGDELRIEVIDHGVGMSREVLERATQPFFSTRAPGEGMGLGLFLAQSVAEQLGGRLELDSQPGRGTRAALVFPDTAVGKPAP